MGRKKINHSDTICSVCGTNTTSAWRKYVVNKENKYIPRYEPGEFWDGKSYICNICYGKEDRKLLYHHNNLIKQMRKFRNKELSRYSNVGEGYIGEQIWCKARGVKNCNIELDNFRSKNDHSPDKQYGMTQTKISSFTQTGSTWNFNTTNLANKEFDHAVLFCMDEYWKNVESVYIIPKEYVDKRHVKIHREDNNKRWYKQFRVDEKLYNDVYHNMNIEDCPVLI